MLNLNNFKTYKLLFKTVSFKITSTDSLSVSDYLLLSDLKAFQRYIYIYEETESQRAKGIVQSPPNGLIHNGIVNTIYLTFVGGEGKNIAFILSYPYPKKLRHLLLNMENQKFHFSLLKAD